MWTEILEGRRRALGPIHGAVFEAMSNFAVFYHGMGKPVEAEKLLSQAIRGSQSAYGESNPEAIRITGILGSLYLSQNRLGEAEPLMSKALIGLSKTLGTGHADDARRDERAGDALRQLWGNQEKAEPLLSHVLEEARHRLGAEHPHTLASVQNMAACYHKVGKLSEAESLFVELLESRRRLRGGDDPDTLTAMHELAECYHSQGKHDQAESLLVDVVKGRQRVLGAEQPETVAAMETLGIVRGNRKNFAEAEQVFRECLEIRKKTMPDSWQRYHTESEIGHCLTGQKKFIEAEPILLSAYDGMKAREKDNSPILKGYLSSAAGRINRLYEAWGKKEKRDEWLTRYADLVFPHHPIAAP